MTGRLIGMDWGTSSFRAWLMGPGGTVLDEIGTARGILSVPQGGFDVVMEQALAPWPKGLAVIASGMVTSRNGWVETPYLPLPLDAAALAGALVPHRAASGRAVHFVTGALGNAGGLPDVMRGEETEIIGHMAAGGGDGLFVLPGTHSKWARAEAGRLTSFRTCMTGEGFALLRDQSILGRLAEPGPFDPAAFARGLAAGRAAGPLLVRAFSARALALTGQLAPAQIADYLSGLLIGDEVAGMVPTGPVTLIGRGDLTARYRIALEAAGTEARIAAPGMARLGLWDIATRAGITG